MAGVIVVLVAVLLGGFVYHKSTTALLKSDLKKLQEQVGSLTVEVATLKASKAQLVSAVERQSEAITDMVRQEEEISQQAEEALARERKQAEEWKGKYAAILNAPRHGTACDSLTHKMTKYFDLRREEGKQ